MNKQLLALLLAVATLACLFAGCAKTEIPAATEPAAEPASAEPAAESVPAAEAALQAEPVPEAAPAQAEAPAAEAAEPAAEPAELAQPPEEAAPPAPPAQDEPGEEPEAPEAMQPSLPLFEELTTFTIWTGNSPDLSDIVDEFNDFTVINEMEKRTNLHWDATIVSFTAETEQFQLMVAAQDYTDVVKGADSYSGGVDQAIEDEFIIDLRPLIADYMPNLTSKFQEHDGMEQALLTLNGCIGLFPQIYSQPSMATSGLLTRQDWMEDLGFDAPKTYDELHDMLAAFHEEKGADSALVIPATGSYNGGSIVGGYGISDGFYHIGDTVYHGMLQPEYKDYLTMLHDWYAEGLIWQDFYTLQTTRLMDYSMILANQVGVWSSGVQDMSTLALQATDPNFKLIGIPEVSLDGGPSHFGEEPSMLDSNVWAITVECDDAESICRYVDYLYSEEGTLLANYGVEGDTFVYDDQGNPHLTEKVTNNPEFEYRVAINLFTCDRQTPVPYVIDQTKSLETYDEAQLATIAVWEDNNTDYAYNMPRSGLNLKRYALIYSVSRRFTRIKITRAISHIAILRRMRF